MFTRSWWKANIATVVTWIFAALAAAGTTSSFVSDVRQSDARHDRDISSIESRLGAVEKASLDLDKRLSSSEQALKQLEEVVSSAATLNERMKDAIARQERLTVRLETILEKEHGYQPVKEK